MSTSVLLQGSSTVWKPPPSKSLDEAVWQAWLAEGRARDRRGNAARIKAVTCVPIAALLIASAGLWFHLAPYDTVIRFVVAFGAIVVMFHAFRDRQYALGVVLGALALIYNPVAPVFRFSGDWQRAVLATSACPFVASLIWKRREAKNG